MTYFLEKNFYLTNDFKIIPLTRLYPTCIRPCNWSYKRCLDFYAGKMDKKILLKLNGACEHYDGKSIEKWLINLALKKNIMPDFECQILEHYSKSYVLKVIDLHTKKTIEDNAEKLISHFKNGLTQF